MTIEELRVAMPDIAQQLAKLLVNDGWKFMETANVGLNDCNIDVAQTYTDDTGRDLKITLSIAYVDDDAASDDVAVVADDSVGLDDAGLDDNDNYY